MCLCVFVWFMKGGVHLNEIKECLWDTKQILTLFPLSLPFKTFLAFTAVAKRWITKAFCYQNVFVKLKIR